MWPGSFGSVTWHGAARAWLAWARALALGGLLLAVASSAGAQDVAPRLTGAMVVSELAKAEQAVKARAATTRVPELGSIAAQLAQIGTALQAKLSARADEPLAIIDAGARDAALRADAAAKQAQAWLGVSAVTCTPDELAAMRNALSAALALLARDTTAQKAPPPVIDGVQTLKQQPVFALRRGGTPIKLVLAGSNLVDVRCANPVVTVIGPGGQPVAVQPQLIAAQPGQVELAWADTGALPAGGYSLELVARHKVFLLGCQAAPPATAALSLLPPARFTVTYRLTATCAGAAKEVGAGTLPVLTASNRLVSRTFDATGCANATGYTMAGTVQTGDGTPAPFGPITQSADASTTAGIGHGLTLSWDPSLRQLLVRAGTDACKGVD